MNSLPIKRAALALTLAASVAAGAQAQAATGASRTGAAQSAVSAQPLVVAGQPTIVRIGGGDQDAFLDPGEVATISVPAVNQGDFKATNVHVTLSTDDPDVTVSTPTQNYKTIKAGLTKSKQFKFFLSSSYPLGKRVALTATTTFIGVNSPTTTQLVIPTGNPSTSPTTVSFTGPAAPMPDGDSSGVNVPLAVTGVGYAWKLTFSVDGDACTSTVGATTVGIDHTWVGDLAATLTSPAGDTITLFNRPGSTGNSGNNICQAVFDDSASSPFAFISVADAPWTGAWLPDQPLGSLIGGSVDGTWTLNVSDNAFIDTGSVRAFSLHFYGFS